MNTRDAYEAQGFAPNQVPYPPLTPRERDEAIARQLELMLNRNKRYARRVVS